MAALGTEVVSLPENGLQNGAPDGIALLDPSNTVVEFLSYEGSFNATDGFATGQTSVDLGVSQSNSTPVGASLERCADSANWLARDVNSFGSVNGNADCPVGPPPPPPTNSGVRINEIHYDNDGGDVGEFIEIAGPAGTALDGWSVALYNGSNGTIYNSLPLAGSLPDCGEQGQGVTLLELPTNGLQNGSPDGIALLDAGGSLVEFISYEGDFSGTEGAANGVTSEDIGVAESSSTPIGFSLQLTTDGSAWQPAAAETRGALNDGTACPVIEPPPVELSCEDSATPIFDIQGSGFTSPLTGNVVEVDAVVVGVFDGEPGSLGGYFLQGRRFRQRWRYSHPQTEYL